MSFSYNDGLTTPKDRVRFMLGDVNEPGYRSDETILALLDDYPENQTTMILADSLAAEFSMKPSNITSPEGSTTWGDRVNALQDLATRLKLEIDVGVVAAATDKLASFAPVRESAPNLTAEYRRPVIFWNQDGEPVLG